MSPLDVDPQRDGHSEEMMAEGRRSRLRRGGRSQKVLKALISTLKSRLIRPAPIGSTPGKARKITQDAERKTMTDRPPHDPNRRPNLEGYRPSEERGDPRLQGPREPSFGSEPRTHSQPTAPPRHGGPVRPPQGYPATGRPTRVPPPDYLPPLREPEAGSSSGMSTGYYVVIGALVCLAALAAFAVTIVPADVVRDRIIATVKERTGRDLIIKGDAKFTLYPSAGVSLGDVSLSSPPGWHNSTPLLSAESLEAQVALLPLLRREVSLEKLVLHKPIFTLEVDKGGRKSWEFAAQDFGRTRLAAAEPANGHATDAPAPGLVQAQPSGAINGLRLDDVRIEDGTVYYSDQRTNTAREVRSITADLGATSLASPLTAKGSFVWKSRKIDFDGSLTSIGAIMERRPAKLTLATLSDAAETSFDGTVTLEDWVGLEGILTARAPSARNLLAVFETIVPPSKGFGPFEAKGLLRTNAKSLTLSNAELKLDGATAFGQVTLETAGARPYVKANLKLSELNLNTYATDPDAVRAMPASPATAPSQGAPSPPAQSIEDLLSRDPAKDVGGAKVKGYTQRAGWAEEPLNLAVLGLLDADAKLSIGRILLKDMKIGQSELTIALKNRQAKAVVDDMMLYEGRGRGFITIDAAQVTSGSYVANLTFDGISAQPLLKDASGIDRLTGKGKLALALAGQGANERQIVETLSGKADFSFADGALLGLNIPQMLRQPGSNDSTGLQKTDFSELSSSWTITAGVAQNQDLRFIGPLVRMSGSGSVSLPPRELDYTLRPRIVADLTGQGGDQNANGIEVPVRVTGGWDQPRIGVDFQAIAKDPNKVVDTVKDLGKQLKGKNAGEIVDSLLGKKGQEGGGKKLLDQLLKGQ